MWPPIDLGQGQEFIFDSTVVGLFRKFTFISSVLVYLLLLQIGRKLCPVLLPFRHPFHPKFLMLGCLFAFFGFLFLQVFSVLLRLFLLFFCFGIGCGFLALSVSLFKPFVPFIPGLDTLLEENCLIGVGHSVILVELIDFGLVHSETLRVIFV